MKFTLSIGLLIAIWSIVAVVWIFDSRPVQKSVERIVVPPSSSAEGGIFRVIHKTYRERACKTMSVQHFLIGPMGRGWPLLAHGGMQRKRDAKPHEYITELRWPKDAGPGRYIWRLVLKFKCNPLKDIEEIHETPFVVR